MVYAHFKNNIKNLIMSIRRFDICLVIGHMRSGSTLLVHLLANNSAISGYGESHIRYKSPEDFNKLIRWIRDQRMNELILERYILDKILHNGLLEDLRILQQSRVKVIFLVREPKGSINSLVKTFGEKWGWSEKDAVEYYTKRLTILEEYFQWINPNSAAFITHQQLLLRTEEVLEMLQKFLGLPEALEPSYRPLPTTGKWGYGDGSRLIQTGEIHKRQDSEKQIEIPREYGYAFDIFENTSERLYSGVEWKI